MQYIESNNVRHELVKPLVAELYLNSTLPAARWMWETHVQVVAAKAEEIAVQVNADIEKTVAAALLHDIADTKLLRSDELHDDESKAIANEILEKASFTAAEIREIIVEILGTHSAYPENMPKTLEAQVISTADAYGHLGTNFYNDMTIEKLKLFGLIMTSEQHRQWVLKKIERDFYNKIFFENIRQELSKSFEAIKNKYV